MRETKMKTARAKNEREKAWRESEFETEKEKVKVRRGWRCRVSCNSHNNLFS